MEKLTEVRLPFSKEEIQTEHERRVEIFKHIIVSKEEEKAFFESPTKYLKAKGALNIASIRLPDGVELPFIEDDAARNYFRKLREQYQNGDLSVMDRVSDSTNVLVRDYAVYETNTLWTKTHNWTETQGVSRIEEIGFGPLVSEAVTKKFQAVVRDISAGR